MIQIQKVSHLICVLLTALLFVCGLYPWVLSDFI